MPKSARFLASLLAIMTLIVAAIALAGPSSAAPARRAAATAPCGQPNYPPCPPAKSISVSPTTVHRGQLVTITVKHYPAFRTVTVHLAGHGRYITLGSARTNARGNVTFSVRIPSHIPTGGYTLYVKVGSTTKAFHLTVLR